MNDHQHHGGLTLAEAARTLAAARAQAGLGTLRDDDGAPYVSLVDYWCQRDGDAVLLLSRLAEHRRYLDADPRASLLISAAPVDGVPALTGARLTLVGAAQRIERDAAVRDGYLRRHPQAAVYIDFADFDFYHLRVASARYIAGFGRMGWLGAAAYRDAEPDLLAEIADDAIRHMNDDHGDSLRDCAEAFGAGGRPERCRMTAVDRYGFDLFCFGADAGSPLRLSFPAPLGHAAELRAAMTQMAAQARRRLG